VLNVLQFDPQVTITGINTEFMIDGTHNQSSIDTAAWNNNPLMENSFNFVPSDLSPGEQEVDQDSLMKYNDTLPDATLSEQRDIQNTSKT